MNTEKYQGLTDSEVQESRRLHGENIIRKRKRDSLTIFFEVVREPMVILLVAASLIYFLTGQFREGVIMMLAIGFVSGISIYQQIRSEKAIDALQKLTRSLVAVIRNGQHVSLPSEELVYGDIMVVSEGQEVPADAAILEHNDLAVDESILTGESFAVEKNGNDSTLFAGTTVVSGLGHARVTAVGNRTRIGKLGITMEEIRKEKTPLQMQVNSFVQRMAIFGIVAFLIVTGINYLESGDLLLGIMHGLALAMAVLPEEIPVALSTFMALGAYQMIRNNIVAKHPQTVEALGAATVICLDKTGTITENRMKVSELYDFTTKEVYAATGDLTGTGLQQLILQAFLASEPIPFDPMEVAIHELYEGATLRRDTYTMIGEYPLSGSPPLMTHVYKDAEGKRLIVCKGSPEAVMRNSNLSESEREAMLANARKMAAKGNRVLGVGLSDYGGKDLPASQEEFHWKFSGLVALSDPPKKNIPLVIRDFLIAGIQVKMITGDFPETACSIARQIGMNSPESFLTGRQISGMNDTELSDAVAGINVFARVTPEAKLRIIRALKERGEVVAMTGDGVNDGPALKAAHIGIAMGERGSEVARQAASLVLTNDDLSSMVTAISYGRKIYSNLKQAVQYIISIHIPLISIVTLPLMLGWKYPNIFNPVHIIFLELVMGPTCSIVFENEPLDRSQMIKPPHKVSRTFFTWKELWLSVIQGSLITAGLLLVLYSAIRLSFDEANARTLVFTTLIFSNVFLTLTGRSKTQSVFRTIRNRNYLVPLVIFITLGLLFLSIYYPPLQEVFGFVPLGMSEIFTAIGVAAVFVFWIELYKLVIRQVKDKPATVSIT